MRQQSNPTVPEVIASYAHQAALDRLAIEAAGKPLTVPRFCREMGRLLEREEHAAEVRRAAPLFGREG